jgi:putative membrane protein
MTGIIDRLGRTFTRCRSFIGSHMPRTGRDDLEKSHSEIQRDLSELRTFFAWQRNHMANERTFLAWCRTGISLIIFSFVIERFDLLIRELRMFSTHPEVYKALGRTHYMGVVIFVLGAFIIILAGWRFFYIRKHINQGGAEFSSLPDVFLMGSVLLTALMLFMLFLFLF